MATFVLISGAGGGGWAWKEPAAMLRARGHEAYPVTTTGLGERSHLISKDVDLAMHTQDIVNVLRYEDLRDVFLVGHSFGGNYLPRVAVAEPERLAHLVWLDATVLNEGEAFFQGPPFNRTAEQCRRIAERVRAGQSPPSVNLVPLPKAGDPAPDPATMSEEMKMAMDWRSSPHPTLCLVDPMEAPGFEKLRIPITFFYCTREPSIRAVWNYERAKERGWPIIELDASHGITRTNPLLLVESLDALTRK